MEKFSQAVLNTFLENLKKAGVESHSIVVWHDGKIILKKAFWPYDLDDVHPVWSVTKSFTSMAFGLMMEENPVDLDEPWIDFFPEYRKYASPLFLKATIRNILTMTLGQDFEALAAAGDDWLKVIVSQPVVYEPGTVFFYNSNCSYLIGRLIERRTGMSLAEYLKPRLFEPLGFGEWYWDRDEEGHCLGGYGLHIRVEDMAKFGECILENGKWEGKQILPSSWISQALSKQAENKDAYPKDHADNREGYGYYFWMCRHHSVKMSGLHGQLCFLMPQEHLVIAMNNAASGSQVLLDNLFAAFEAPRECPERDGQVSLPEGERTSPYEENILGSHSAEENPAGITGITIEKKDDVLSIALQKKEESFSFRCAYGKWLEQENHFHGYTHGFWYDMVASGDEKKRSWNASAGYAFVSEDILKVEVRERNEAAQHHFTFTITENRLVLDYSCEAIVAYLPAYRVYFSLH